MTDDLIKLAERVEAATGPDRELDIAIWLGSIANEQQRKLVEQGRELHGDGEADFRADRMMDGRRYTASIDAALTLVPEGHDWVLLDHRASYGSPYAEVKSGDDRVADHVGRAATPALALTAAALRAHLEAKHGG